MDLGLDDDTGKRKPLPVKGLIVLTRTEFKRVVGEINGLVML